MVEPLISVIVTVYKVESYLRQCLDSIVCQTYQNLEIILVDDGSPDGCSRIIDEYAEKESRIKAIHKENGGVSSARNKGLDFATGTYITFVDSDDVVDSRYVEFLFESLKKSCSDVSVCQRNRFAFDFPVKQDVVLDRNVKILSGTESVKRLYLGLTGNKKNSVDVYVWGKLYKKDLFEAIRFPEGKIHEDDAVVPLVLYKAKQVCVLPDSLYFYRMTENSITRKNFSMRRYDCIDVTDKCISFFEKCDSKIANLAKIRRKQLICTYSLQARKSGIYDEISIEYRISRFNAAFYLWKLGKINFKEFVAYIFPNLYGLYGLLKSR